MRKCKTCPHDIGDAYERDCCFPDCEGGWEEVYNKQCERIAELKLEIEADNRNAVDFINRIAELDREVARLEALEARFKKDAGEATEYVLALVNKDLQLRMDKLIETNVGLCRDLDDCQ